MNAGENLDFQQLIRILKVCLGLFHAGVAGPGDLSLNQSGSLVVKD